MPITNQQIDLETLYGPTQAATEEFNLLDGEFMAAGSGIETVARERTGTWRSWPPAGTGERGRNGVRCCARGASRIRLLHRRPAVLRSRESCIRLPDKVLGTGVDRLRPGRSGALPTMW
ncbi:DUF5713 family protein [Streptomyces sp. NPDC051704]|uniref:DUF5713 family protein n=1 Tax=Streptomyces sp. NPDC051704 TaxID=3365671 RepID=UPI0037AD8D13